MPHQTALKIKQSFGQIQQKQSSNRIRSKLKKLSVNIVTKGKANKLDFFAVPASAVAHAVQSTLNAYKNGTNQRFASKQQAEPFTTTSKSSSARFASSNILAIYKKTVNSTNFSLYKNLKDSTLFSKEYPRKQTT